MNGDDLLDLLMLRLGNRTETDLRAACLTEMAHIQATELERGPTLPFFLKDIDDALAYTAAKTVDLPSDFLKEWDEEHTLSRLDSSGELVGLHKDDFDVLVDKWGYYATGEVPEDYAIVGEKIYLFPTPTVAGTLFLPYYAAQAAPTDAAAENKWLKYASDLLLARTGEVISLLHLRDADLAALFVKMTADAQKRLLTMEITREEAGRSRGMGDD